MDLTIIDTAGHRLAPGAAASWARMRAAGLPSGAVTTAYRTTAEQTALYAAYKAGKGNFALAPGKSEHEKGLAVDVSGALRTWMIANSAAHGWRRTNPAEPWHFEYATSRDTHLVDVTTPTPITPTTQEDDMRHTIIFATGDGTKAANIYGSTAIIDPISGFTQTSTGTGDRAELNARKAIAGVLGYEIKEVVVDANGWNLAKAKYTRATK